MREAGNNKVGIDFLSFPLTSCQCSRSRVSLPPVLDSGMAYPWNTSSHFVFFSFSQSLLQKVEQCAEHLVLISIISSVLYIWGRKKIVCVEYLLEMHIFVYRWEIEISVYMWKGGRKLTILVDYYYRYSCSSQPPNSSHALHFFLELLVWIWILIVCLQVVNSFFRFTFFILPRRDILCHWLPLSAWRPLGNDPSRSIPVATSDIISLLQFWFLWLIVHDIYVHHTYVSCSSLICWWRFCCLSVESIVSIVSNVVVLVGIRVPFWMMDLSVWECQILDLASLDSVFSGIQKCLIQA